MKDTIVEASSISMCEDWHKRWHPPRLYSAQSLPPRIATLLRSIFIIQYTITTVCTSSQRMKSPVRYSHLATGSSQHQHSGEHDEENREPKRRPQSAQLHWVFHILSLITSLICVRLYADQRIQNRKDCWREYNYYCKTRIRCSDFHIADMSKQLP